MCYECLLHTHVRGGGGGDLIYFTLRVKDSCGDGDVYLYHFAVVFHSLCDDACRQAGRQVTTHFAE